MKSVFTASTPDVAVTSFLASRGFKVRSQASTRQTVLPVRDSWTDKERNLLFDVFHSSSERNQLLSFIEADEPVTSPQVLTLIQSDHFKKNRNAFSTTFEWYVAELLVREFGAFSSAFGVRLEDIRRNVDEGDPGDFDVLSVLRNMQLIYVETKTGRFGQNDVRKAVQRGLSIHSLATIMLVGRSVTSQRVRQVLAGYTHPIAPVHKFTEIHIKGVPQSNVFRCIDCFFVPADSTSSDLESKIRTVLRILAADIAEKNRVVGLDAETYQQVGYSVREIKL